MKNGLIHLYCGDGKGKTTAAVGLAVRAAGYGKQVVFVQFLKGTESGELAILRKQPTIRVIKPEHCFGFFKTLSETERKELTLLQDAALQEAVELVEQNQCDLLILDEISAAYEYGVVSKAKVENLVLNKQSELELVLTGRNPAPVFVENADYITEMKKIKHPYESGIPAREGIEM